MPTYMLMEPKSDKRWLKMKITNEKADYYLSVLKIISTKVSGKLGYAVARNIRELSTSLSEYTGIKNTLITKYGENNGKEIILSTESENYQKYFQEIKDFADIKHDVNIMLVDPEDIYKSNLTADVISKIMFMVKDGEQVGWKRRNIYFTTAWEYKPNR